MKAFKKLAALLLVVCMLVGLVACGGAKSGSSTEGKGNDEGIKIALSNSILTNQWRVQSVKIFELYCQQLKDQGIVSEYYATSSGDDAQAQINEIKNLISKHYDVILVDCASDALSSVLEEAAAEGITVVTYDNICETPNTYSISVDAYTFGTQQAQWMADQLGGKGNIIIIRGKSGASDDEKRYQGYMDVLKNYPDIKIVGEDFGGWDYGTTSEVMNSLMAANEGTKIDGVLQEGMGEAAIVETLEDYKYNPADVAITGEWTNGYFRLAVEKNLNCFITGVPCYISAEAVDFALKIKNGEEVERNIVEAPPVIDKSKAADYYVDSQGDDFMPVFTDEKNTWNITLEDLLKE